MDSPSLEQKLQAAISKMRAEIDVMLDEEFPRLSSREAPVRSIEPADLSGGSPHPPPSAMRRNYQPDGAILETRPPSLVSSDHQDEGPGEGDPEDTGRRLDALAHKLEDRLKRARDREAERSGTRRMDAPSGPPPGGGP